MDRRYEVRREELEAAAVLVFDPSAFPKHGAASVGVQRQWCGRLGKVENCQVGVYLAYVARADHALVVVRLYLPETWAADKTRRKTAGVPKGVRFRTRHALALAGRDSTGHPGASPGRRGSPARTAGRRARPA